MQINLSHGHNWEGTRASSISPLQLPEGENAIPGSLLPHHSYEARWARCFAPQAGQLQLEDATHLRPECPDMLTGVHIAQARCRKSRTLSLQRMCGKITLSAVVCKTQTHLTSSLGSPSAAHSPTCPRPAPLPETFPVFYDTLSKVTWSTQFSAGLLCAQLLVFLNLIYLIKIPQEE